MSSTDTNSKPALSVKTFRRQLRNLILMTWNIPPVFGLSFLLFINMFTLEQMAGILSKPLLPAYIIFSSVFSIWYYYRITRPIVEYLESPDEKLAEQAAASIRSFPLHYWGLFLTYLILAPVIVITSAEIYTDFTAQPIDWFRIELVALIVSIIVGLPIFFLVLDLFGQVMTTIPLDRPHVTIKKKVFLIGALIPLLIDTMLVQYYWTRTGFFNSETFLVWLMLELLAIGGSLIFVKSFGQSLAPLESLTKNKGTPLSVEIEHLNSQSTDEIGVLTKYYRKLLNDLKIQSEMLGLNNLLLSKTGHQISVREVADTVVSLSGSALSADKVFLILFDEAKNELVGVAQTGDPYNEEGHFRLGMDEISMAVMVFKAGKTIAISDVQQDSRCSSSMRARFNVQSALVTPLIADAKPIGVLMAVSNTVIRDFTDREIAIIEGFAREAALAIHTHILNLSRNAAEAKGKEQQEHIELLMRSTEEAIYGVDLSGVCTFVNPSCMRLLGYTDENEIIGENIHQLIHHSLADGTNYSQEDCKIRQSTRGGVSGHSTEEVHWRKDGTSFPIEYWSHPIRKEGVVVGTVVSFVDITDRLKAEQSRQESETKYRNLFESSGVAIFIMKDGLITDCNHKTLDLYKCSREQFIGKSQKDLSTDIQPDNQNSEEKFATLTRKAYEGQNQFHEWLCSRPDGTLFPAEMTLSRLTIDQELFIQVVIRDISKRKEAEETINHMAYHDNLTGLVNRHKFEDRMTHALESIKERGVKHALLYIDLDQFKVVNDTSGHDAGDELLKQIAQLIHDPIRERDTLARLGGDEFGVLLENCPTERAEDIANQIVRLVREFRFIWNDKTFSVGASVGIALLNDAGQTTNEVLKTADMACYMAKDLGRNRTHLFTPGDAELLKRETEMSIVSQIHNALDNDRFLLYHQTILFLGKEKTTTKYSEIFVRMVNSEGEILAAESFVSSAERYNLMPEIDRWVIQRAFAYAAKTKNDKQKQILFINLSGTSFNDESFFTFVKNLLTKENLDPTTICFEVTETAAIANITKAQKFIRSIKALGCRFALDDFGSGLSSFSYLKDLDVDYLKIDGSFIRDIQHDNNNSSIVEAITQLGKSMGILTVAEFVENDEIIKIIKEIGVDFGQGYGIDKPKPLE